MLMAVALCSNAQKPENERRQQRGREQLIEYRHKFLAKDLDLSADQQTRFFALYDEMNDRLEALNDEFRDRKNSKAKSSRTITINSSKYLTRNNWHG